MRKNVDYKLEDIQNILSPVFEDQGFYFNPSQNQFIKNSKIGYSTVILYPQVSGTKYLVDIHLGSRVDEVEKLVFSFFRELPAANNLSVTASVPYKKLIQEKHPRIFASTDLELMQQLEKFHKFMDKDGFKFLENLESLLFLNDAFNTTPEKPIIYQYNPVMRAFRGVAIAKLLYRPIGDLASVYRNKVLKNVATNSQKEKFEEFVSSII